MFVKLVSKNKTTEVLSCGTIPKEKAKNWIDTFHYNNGYYYCITHAVKKLLEEKDV